MKIYILIATLLISFHGLSQTPRQGIKIMLYEKTKGDEAVLAKNTKVKITLNDTLVYNVTTNEEGRADIETPSGKFAVKIKKDSCQTIITHGIIVNENNRAYYTAYLTCEKYLNTLSKKELKKLGYKIDRAK